MCRNSHLDPSPLGAKLFYSRSIFFLCFIFLKYFFLLRTGCAALLRRNS